MGPRRASPADGIPSYLDGVAERTIKKGGDSSRPDGGKLPVGPAVFVVSDHGHTVRCSRRDLRNTLSKYWEAKRGHFDDPRVFLGTWRDDDTKGDKPKYVLDLSRPVVGLVTALEAGTQNVQDSIYHPASGKCIEVLSQADVAYVKADVAGCRDFDLATKFALLNSQRLALPRDVLRASRVPRRGDPERGSL